MKKILVIRFSSIGDIVLTSPVLRCLKKIQGGCEVHYLTKHQFEFILSSNPNVDKVFGIHQHIREVLPQLKKEHYDFVIDLHHNLRSFQVKNSLRRKSSAFPKLNIEKWIRVNLKLNRLPETHVVDRYFKAAEKAGVKNDGEGLDFFIPTKTHVDLLSSGCENGKFTAFAIGGKFGTKKMPAEKIASICKKIKGRIVLLGGAEDVLVANEIARICGETIVNLCGTLSLFESAFVIKQSRLLVSHDTGLMHIGAALKKEIVSLWGNTIPEFGMSPYYGTHSVRGMISEVKHLDCRPCSKIGFAACPKGHFKCMLNQNEEAIAGFVNGVV